MNLINYVECGYKCQTCDQGNVNNCLTCKTGGNRNPSNNCDCMERYYNDNVNPICQCNYKLI